MSFPNGEKLPDALLLIVRSRPASGLLIAGCFDVGPDLASGRENPKPLLTANEYSSPRNSEGGTRRPQRVDLSGSRSKGRAVAPQPPRCATCKVRQVFRLLLVAFSATKGSSFSACERTSQSLITSR
jgi:hypothetical protein